MLSSRLCLRAAARPQLQWQPISLPLTTLGLRTCPPSPLPNKRIFASTPRHRKADTRIASETQAKQIPKESVKPESTEKAQPAEPEPTQKDALLSEQTKSNKEQRKADWRIIKDMSQYLWPKDDMGTRFRVGLSVALLVGAKVRMLRSTSSSPSLHSPTIFAPSSVESAMLIAICTQSRSSTSKSPSTSNPSSTA